MSIPHVVIIGGGFGGLNAARALRKDAVRITLIDKTNHHLFQPLLYQVATAGLSATDIATPIRRVLRGQANVHVRLDRAQSIDRANRVVHCANGQVSYDFLIVAAGAVNQWFGHDEWAAHAPGLKSIDDAMEIRRRVLTAFEHAENEPQEQKQREWTTFVVVGGGATGVEMAGSLIELSRHTVAGDYRTFDPAQARVILVDAGPRLLAGMSEVSSANALEQLQGLGVDVRAQTFVTDVRADGVQLTHGDEVEFIPSRTVVWAAGVAASPLGQELGERDRAGRVHVQPDLSLPGHPEVFVIGDMARVLNADGSQVPGVAPAAIQGGQHAAAMVRADLAGSPRRDFVYNDKGSMATIGRKRAVAERGGLRMRGFIAWLAWMGIHVLFLVGFRNRVAVMLDWAWAYVSYQRSARLIWRRPLAALPGRSPDPKV